MYLMCGLSITLLSVYSHINVNTVCSVAFGNLQTLWIQSHVLHMFLLTYLKPSPSLLTGVILFRHFPCCHLPRGYSGLLQGLCRGNNDAARIFVLSWAQAAQPTSTVSSRCGLKPLIQHALEGGKEGGRGGEIVPVAQGCDTSLGGLGGGGGSRRMGLRSFLTTR